MFKAVSALAFTISIFVAGSWLIETLHAKTEYARIAGVFGAFGILPLTAGLIGFIGSLFTTPNVSGLYITLGSSLFVGICYHIWKKGK